MNDLNERIRDFIDAGSLPVSPEEIYGQAFSVPVTPHGGEPRPRVRRPLFVLSGVAAFAAVVSLVVSSLVTVPGVKNNGVPPASAATFLRLVAKTAANQRALIPGPGQFLYVATISSMTNGSAQPPSRKTFFFDSDELRQVWTSPRLPGHETYVTVGKPLFLSAGDRAIWVADGSPALGSGNSSGPVPPYFNVADLPTKPSDMPRYLRSQSYLPGRSSYESWSSWEFDVALGFLQSGASSAQRAAILRFIATIPGVRLMGHATSVVTGHVGSVIGRPIRGAGLMEEALFDPTSSNLLETRYVVTRLTSRPAPFMQPTQFVGEIQSYSDFVFAGLTRAHTNYSLPVGTPTFPHVWPFGAVREPLSGWLGRQTN